MNVIFIAVFTISVAVMAFIEPNAVVGAMTEGGKKALELTFSLTVIYAVWLGVSEVAEKAGVNKKIAKLLSPAVDKLFKNADEETKKHLSMNISANLLGLGGVATPYGINAANLLDKKGDTDGLDKLFIIAATSIQILPTTVISLRQSYNSVAAADIFLPTLLSTIVSTLSGLLMLKIFKARKK
ncbi:MAG: hypothetical protein IJ706_10235 [Clostridia bacterium]|nr:hypothetical protein [Clostridia bacterium]